MLEDWIDAVCRELELTDLDQGRAARDLVLDLARDVAHNVARPAAPLTAYLLGVAVGRAAGPQAAAELASRVARLAVGWPSASPAADQAPATASGGPPTTYSDRDATLRRAPPGESRNQEPL